MSATDTRAVVQQLVRALESAAWWFADAKLPARAFDEIEEALPMGLALLAALPEQTAAPQGDSVAGSGLPLDTVRTGEEGSPRYAPWSAKTDAEMLSTLSFEFENSMHYCDCGRSEGLRDFDCASMLRDYMAQRSPIGAVSVPAETASGARPQDEHAHPVIGVVLPSQSVRIGGEGWTEPAVTIPTRIARGALEAIEAGANAWVVMNVDYVKEQLRAALAGGEGEKL